jgi:hypothetical protein
VACWSLSLINTAPSNTDPYPGPFLGCVFLTICTGQFPEATFTLLSYRMSLDFFMESPKLRTYLPVTPFVVDHWVTAKAAGLFNQGPTYIGYLPRLDSFSSISLF